MTQAVYLTKGSTTVYIESAKVDELITNAMIKVNMPVTPNKQDTKAPGTLVVDLKKIQHVFNIMGYLSASHDSDNYGGAWSGGTMTSAKDVKSALVKDILFSSGDIELHYRDLVDTDYSENYNDNKPCSSTFVRVSLDKVSITDGSIISDTPTEAGINRYKIQINLTRGKIRGQA